MSERCSNCNDWVFGFSVHAHVCLPAFYVWSDYSHGPDDQGDKVHAYDAQTAAEQWANEFDSDGDYTIIGGSPQTVRVTAADGGEPQWFEVYGESVPTYHANKVEAPR